MKLILFAVVLVVLLLQLISVNAAGGGSLIKPTGGGNRPDTKIINEDYEFWTLDCKRRPVSGSWYTDQRFDEIFSPSGSGTNYGSFQACGTGSCRGIKRGFNCKDICNETFKESDEDQDYGDLKSCPDNYGFIGYCKDKRGVDQYIRICMFGNLYPNNGAPLITQSGVCTGDDGCGSGIKYGDGDCDSDDDCGFGLWCGDENCRSMHRKGLGRGCFESSDDCCTGKDPWNPNTPVQEQRRRRRRRSFR